ncbi:Gamma-aminobutyric acid type B receptor subunit 2 [Holothuria leucospilota]|uniref:Gamma-aminobutyric acid type B receptor subunit 2 n=1 Tax=Holothuria leucospilota TaxID=206669 RepID=A0A9Q1CH09_HOLLE|nr:Gamma-aminobutyric acid type B receptor subunit 2 [Holothuria leucospilota]
MLSEALENVNFTGVSGPVNFHQGERIGTTNITQLQAQCGEGWKIHSSYCYLFVASQKSWDEADRFCRGEGGFLVSILSEDENEALINLGHDQISRGINQWWVSLTESVAGDLQWSGGPERKVKWSPWEQGILKEDDADNNPDEDKRDGDILSVDLKTCYILDAALKTWLPVKCTSTLYCFICKKRAEYDRLVLATLNVKNEIEWVRDIVWPGGVFPLDHTPVALPRKEEIYEGISSVIYITTCSAATCGLLFAIVCLIFNFKYRKQIFIKMSSPNLNSLIIIGCTLIYVSACMAGSESFSDDSVIFLKLHQMRVWSFSIGFVLSFGSMFSKTWRVHKVAALKNPKRAVVTDRHLFVMVGAFLSLEVTVLSAWFIISPMRVEKTYLPNKDMEIDSTVILQPYIQYCTSDHQEYWEGALYGYKALLLIFGVFLAWETRKVNIPALNDSKLIGLCVYNVVLLSAISVGVKLVLTTDPSMSFLFTSGILIFATTVVLGIIFIPKMISVIQYPEGKPVTTMKPMTNTGAGTTDGSEDSAELRTDVEQLRSQLKELQKECPRCQRSGCGFWCKKVVCRCCNGIRLQHDHDSVVESSLATETSNNLRLELDRRRESKCDLHLASD